MIMCVFGINFPTSAIRTRLDKEPIRKKKKREGKNISGGFFFCPQLLPAREIRGDGNSS